MKPGPKQLCIAALAFGVLLTLLTAASAQQTALQQADAAWNEKSYARALELYRKALDAKQVADTDEVQYRIAVSLGKTEKWDEAVAAGEKLLETTQWKARVLYWLGRLYHVMPHHAWKVGDELYRGRDYPKIEGAEQPLQVWLQQEDAQKTLDYFERAKIEARKERELLIVAIFDRARPPHALSSDEEIDLNFDLAAFLPTQEQQKFIEELNKAVKENRKLPENVDLTQPYNRDWNLPTKVLYLYNEIPRLDQSKDKADTARSLLAKGLFVRSYRQRMDNWASQYDQELKKQVMREYPFDHLEPMTYWQQLVNQFPNSPLAPQTQILIAQTYQQRGDLAETLKAYQVVLDRFPKSKWTNDANAQIQQITKKEISLNTMAQQPPGKNAKLNVSTRNLQSVNFAAYKIRLEEFLTQPSRLNDVNTNFQEFGKNFGNVEQVRRRAYSY